MFNFPFFIDCSLKIYSNIWSVGIMEVKPNHLFIGVQEVGISYLYPLMGCR